MNLCAPFIKRPVATALLTVGVAIAGAVAFTQLPVAPLPQVDFPTVNVQVDADTLSMVEHAETAVYRTAQEALQNAAKHADARSVQIRLYRQKDRAVLEVTDDGSGFDTAEVPAGGTHGGPTGFGLSGMRERAELLGGHLELASTPGRGTTVRLAIPYLPASQSRPG